MTGILNVIYPKPATLSGAVIASQSLTVSTVAISATGYPTQTSVELVEFTISAADVRARWDGVDPTAAVGHLLTATTFTPYIWPVARFNAAKFIRTAATDAVLFASPLSS